jgi:quercetin dioxygenase-like cupin family protein
MSSTILFPGREVDEGGISVTPQSSDASKAIPSFVYDWLTRPAEPTPVGVRRPMCDAPSGTTDRLAIHATTLNPGQKAHEPHRHPEEELIIVKEGTLRAMLNDQAFMLHAGSVFFIAPNDLHGTTNIGDGQATYYVIRWWTPATGK